MCVNILNYDKIFSLKVKGKYWLWFASDTKKVNREINQKYFFEFLTELSKWYLFGHETLLILIISQTGTSDCIELS